MSTKLKWQIIKPSTHNFIKEARKLDEYSLFDLLHGYIYARWPFLYIAIGTGEHQLTRIIKPIIGGLTKILNYLPSNNGYQQKLILSEDRITFADTYHGKVVPLESARQLVSIQEDICITNLEHIIPYKRAKDIIVQNPDHIVVLECPCRTARPDPCLPLDVCLIIGEPFAGFVLEHHPHKARSIDPNEAAQILQEEHQRGHVHHAFFKDAMFGRFYAICNCCSCCCGAMEAHRNGTPMLASSGYTAHLDDGNCIGCNSCEELCQFNAIHVINGLAEINEDKCMGCGVCVDHCDQAALTLHRNYSKGEPLIIRELVGAKTEFIQY
jgi:ferredoxin